MLAYLKFGRVHVQRDKVDEESSDAISPLKSATPMKITLNEFEKEGPGSMHVGIRVGEGRSCSSMLFNTSAYALAENKCVCHCILLHEQGRLPGT